MIELLKRYCLSICCINGLDTYIISPLYYDLLAADEDFRKDLSELSIYPYDAFLGLLQTARENAGILYLALADHKSRKGRYEWEPVLCYKNENTFYHVSYRSSWKCRDCGYILYAPVIRPMVEVDSGFYFGTERKYPDIPPLFQKVPCPKCGHLLQCHLHIMDGM